MSTVRSDEPSLAVVVITRNEARNVAGCLDAVVRAVAAHAGTRIVLVDSDSSDDTVAIAARYPVEVYRYRGPVLTAAAGRRIGFERVCAGYVLFVDGDCRIEPRWLDAALALLRDHPDVAVVHGARRDAHNPTGAEGAEGDGVDTALEDHGLGGNGLYRSAVLRRVGGFNPYLVAEEEGELLGRIRAAGWRAERTSEVMITHCTVPKDTVRGFLARLRRGMTRGPGEVLRLSLGQGSFAHHARRFNRYLMTLGYLASGVVLCVLGIVLWRPALPFAWLAAGVLAFLGLWARRRSLRSALYIVSDWIVVATTMVGPFLRRQRPPESFAPDVERLTPPRVDAPEAPGAG